MANAEPTETESSPPETPAPVEKAPPIDSRFLFVDVASQRAKQLRRGALPRLQREATASKKLERLAMEEVRHGFILYTLPTQYGHREDA
jgi:DNA-directed RNA polymerase subunit K/omega